MPESWTLIANVRDKVTETWYGPAWGNASDVPEAVARRITNPGVWDGGEAPFPAADPSTAAGVTVDTSGFNILTGDTLAEALANLDAALGGLVSTYVVPTYAAVAGIESHNGSGSYTVQGDCQALHLDLTGDMELTLPTPANKPRHLWVLVNASGDDRELSFINDVDWMGSAPGTIHSETGRLILLKWGGGPEGSGTGWFGVDFWQLVGA